MSRDDPASARMREIALDRMHAGLGLPCDRCGGPCQIDGITAPKPAEATGEPFRHVPIGCTCPLNARTCPAHGARSGGQRRTGIGSYEGDQ